VIATADDADIGQFGVQKYVYSSKTTVIELVVNGVTGEDSAGASANEEGSVLELRLVVVERLDREQTAMYTGQVGYNLTTGVKIYKVSSITYKATKQVPLIHFPISGAFFMTIFLAELLPGI